ncbi:MAG: hypothetical protein COW71_06190 [Ignavibacteriales bacterium CG18_big_fil_WC_8_21_14_2_50_31_20]|nr:MAG: hypothetical protein COW71_06190 [Ignavibacteriales bacterium CG18_big_fil_WC_8_21_14_2_50_31_20]
MKVYVIVNSLGLLLDILGAFLIWKYSKTDALKFIEENGSFFWDGSSETDKIEFKKQNKYSHIGLLLMIFGFILMLISNFIPQNYELMSQISKLYNDN